MHDDSKLSKRDAKGKQLYYELVESVRSVACAGSRNYGSFFYGVPIYQNPIISGSVQRESQFETRPWTLNPATSSPDFAVSFRRSQNSCCLKFLHPPPIIS